MSRVFLFVLDSVGIGGAPDAAAYGDEGADTLGHIAAACAAGRADEGRSGPLRLPHLEALGLFAAAALSAGRAPSPTPSAAAFAVGRETSRGKDTPSGHWELAGAPVDFDWGYFPRTAPCFPPDLIAALVAEGGLPGVLGQTHANGMEIIRAEGATHCATRAPIVYTSADSVFQIAAHEEAFGLERLLDLCRIARRLVDPLRIGRVIARPFVGTGPEDFTRTANRRDFATPPHLPTLCDRATASGRDVIGIGKIGDIFAHRGIGDVLKGPDDMALFDHALTMLDEAPEGALVFANFVEFDSLYGHPRDVAGYARALEAFDARMQEATARLRPGDLMILTADHGNDPTWPGADHTREQVPILMAGAGLAPGGRGVRGFADVGATAARWLGVDPGPYGDAIL